jgi:hypothetical protein
MTVKLTAVEFAQQQGVNVRSFRAKLRKEYPQHPKGDPWAVDTGSEEYARWLALAVALQTWWGTHGH